MPQGDRQAVVQERIPLEDEYTDIINKAQRGLGLTLDDLSERTGLSIEQIKAVKAGGYDAAALEKLAFSLNLHTPSLDALAQGRWQPDVLVDFSGFRAFTTVYGNMTVNAYLVWDPNTREAASFDTGSTCEPILAYLQTERLQLKKIFITHTHMDHLADLDRLRAESGGECYGSAVENPLGLKPLRHGDGLILGDLRIRVLGTSGHTPGGLSYFIQGLARPLVITGDALFAGSMGGAPYAYEEALRNNRERILTLPEETIICPGHGPLTTVSNEHRHNPFFPELK